jgi:uncharacterized protein
MNDTAILDATIAFVKKELEQAEGGHDWFHTLRVYNNAQLIAKHEDVDIMVVKLSALLHDIADSKFHNGDESIGPKIASEFLLQQNVDSAIIEHVSKIIENMSFKNSFDLNTSFSSKEMLVVQDADRLDAIGAIGIARCFNYGGFKNRPLYNPEIKPNLNMTKAEYKAAKAPTVNHFYEKLLLLKDQMNTKTGKKLALERHQFMEHYLKQFYKEWKGEV